MNQDEALATKSEWRAHWPVVLAGMAGMALAAMPTYSVGAFLGPLQQQFGWSRAAITSGFTVIMIVGVLGSSLVGVLIDRVGPRRIALPGSVLFLAGMALLSLATPSLGLWRVLWLLFGIGSLALTPAIWAVSVTGFFKRGRGLALAVMLCGTAVASSGIPLLSTVLIEHFGWRMAYRLLPAIAFVSAWPIFYFCLRSPADQAQVTALRTRSATPDSASMEARAALLSFPFLKLGTAAFCFTFAALAILVNFIPIMVASGIGPKDAAAIAGIFGIATVAGRLTSGFLLDRMDGNIIGGFCLGTPIASCLCFVLAPGSIPATMAAVLIIGLCVGAEVNAIAFLTAQRFGTARYGTIFGTISGLWSLSAGLGPLMANRVFDVEHSYLPAIWGLIPLFALASLALFTLGKHK